MIDKLWFLIPELILFAGVVVVAILGLVHSNRLRGWVPWTTGLFIVAAGISVPLVYTAEAMETSGLLVPGLAAPAGMIACIVALGLLLLSIGRVDQRYELAIAQAGLSLIRSVRQVVSSMSSSFCPWPGCSLFPLPMT